MPAYRVVKKEQLFVAIDGKPVWIGKAVVIAEGIERPAIEGRSRKRAVSDAIYADCAGDQERRINYPS